MGKAVTTQTLLKKQHSEQSSDDEVFGVWDASLTLELAKTPRGTRLLSSQHKGPLYVQKPFYPEGKELAHIYLLHPPGGLVSGDTLHTEVTIKADAQALLTTPGAARLYRARPDRHLQTQSTHLKLSANSSIEWLPLETIVYPGAIADLNTRIDLEDDSRFIAWEITCLGLPASNAPFDHGEFFQRFEVYSAGKPLLLERLPLNASNTLLTLGSGGLQGNTVIGLMVAGFCTGREEQQAILERLRTINIPSDSLLASTVINGFVVIRYLGNCGEQARLLLTQCWHILRPEIIGKQAVDPRIWAC